MMKSSFVLAAALACLAAPVFAQEEPYGWTPAGTVTPSPRAMDFLMMAGASDMYEIESSRTVLETTSNPALRSFATMMIEHHTKTSQDAAAAAQRAGLQAPPPMLDRPKAAMVAALGQFEGVERDRLYMTQQMMAHKEALGLMRTYAETGDTPELRTAAQATVPIIQRHLASLEQMSR